MAELEVLFNNVKRWGSEEKTNLIKGSDPVSQYCKLFEEYGELSKNVLKKQDCKDDIGDVMVVLIILSEQLGIDFYSELEKEIIDSYDLDLFVDFKISECTEKQLNVYLSIELTNIGSFITNNMNDSGYILRHHSRLTDAFLSCCFDLIALSTKLGYTIEECLEHSWNVIKDREGIMYEGAWIKSTDPVYKTVLAVMGARRIHLEDE